MGDESKRNYRVLDVGTSTTIGTGLATIGTYDVSDFDFVTFSINNVGTLTDQFEVGPPGT